MQPITTVQSNRWRERVLWHSSMRSCTMSSGHTLSIPLGNLPMRKPDYVSDFKGDGNYGSDGVAEFIIYASFF